MNLTGIMKKYGIFLVLLILLLMPISSASDTFDVGRTSKDITILDDGTTVITEDITYSIKERINGVYRDITLDGGQSITNITVETPGYYNYVDVLNESGYVRIKVWLYKDEDYRQKVSSGDVRVIFHYNFLKGVKVYNDISEFQYIIWDGNEWDESVDNLELTVNLPGSGDNVELWNNPPYSVVDSSWTNSSTYNGKYNVDSSTKQEIRMLMPKEYIASTENADVINKDAKSIIEKQEEDYIDGINTQNSLLSALSVLGAIFLIIPAGIYYLYGREPEISYKADYEYSKPTNDSPAFVNAVVPGNVGITDQNIFHATLLDLINRKYYKVISSLEDNLIIRQTTNDTSNLKAYELDLIDYLSAYERKTSPETLTHGDIILSDLNQEDGESFRKFMEAWKIDINQEIPSQRIAELFIDKGSSMFTIFAILFFILSIIMYIISRFLSGPGSSLMLTIVAVLLFIEAIVMIMLPNTVGGKWTAEGKEFHDKWKNFEKYLKDYSLIKTYPPASIQVWGEYLVYASALGVADKVYDNMKQYFKDFNVSEDYINQSDSVAFFYYGGYNSLSHSVNTMMNPPSSEGGSFGDIGGVGGGFGGGGGGTF